MSDTMTEQQSTELDTAPVTDGQVGSETGAVTESSPDPAEIFDYSQYGDKLVEVKVDGQVQRVPLTEAISGYSRQADYTAKTQQLAAEREQLRQAEALVAALESDPEGTIRLIQEAYGEVSTPTAPDGEPLSPEQERLAKIEQFMEAQQRASAISQIQAEFQALHSKWDPIVPFDEQDLALFAAKGNYPSLEAAFLVKHQDAILAHAAVQQERKQGEEQRTEAKNALSGIEHGSGISGTSTGPAPASYASPEAAGLAALQQLGLA